MLNCSLNLNSASDISRCCGVMQLNKNTHTLVFYRSRGHRGEADYKNQNHRYQVRKAQSFEGTAEQHEFAGRKCNREKVSRRSRSSTARRTVRYSAQRGAAARRTWRQAMAGQPQLSSKGSSIDGADWFPTDRRPVPSVSRAGARAGGPEAPGLPEIWSHDGLHSDCT